MDYEIVWTEEATADFDSLMSYLTENLTEKSVGQFIRTFYRKLDLLLTMPYIGIKFTKREGIRRTLITKRYSLIYVIILDQIYLLRLYDNRSNPAAMEF